MEAKLERRPLSEDLGAEVTGYDFDRVPGEDTVGWLRQALLDHHLLLFRGRTLDPARQIAFTLVFGGEVHTCSPRNRFVPGFPEIVRVCNREGEGLANIGPYWHADALADRHRPSACPAASGHRPARPLRQSRPHGGDHR